MVVMDTWPEAIARAQESLGYRDPGVARTVAGVLSALRPEHRDAFHADLETLASGMAFEVFLDQWWTQAVVDGSHDEESREAALEFADLAVSLRIRAGGGPSLSTAEVEELVGLHV